MDLIYSTLIINIQHLLDYKGQKVYLLRWGKGSKIVYSQIIYRPTETLLVITIESEQEVYDNTAIMEYQKLPVIVDPPSELYLEYEHNSYSAPGRDFKFLCPVLIKGLGEESIRNIFYFIKMSD